MKTLPFISSLALIAGFAGNGCAAAALGNPVGPGTRVAPTAAVVPAQPPAGEVTLTGVIEQRMAIGGETTGWALRYDQDKRIELLFRPADLGRLHPGMAVVLTGTYVTRFYPERGEVRMFSVRVLSQVITGR